MEHKFADNSKQIPRGNEELEICSTNLSYLLHKKICDYIYFVEREPFWYFVLVDSDKKRGFVENIKDGCRVVDNGIIVSFGIGKLSRDFENVSFNDILLIRLNKECYIEVYYVLCDPGRKHKIAAATSAEEIQRHGQILHVAYDADPPEAVLFEVIKNLYQGGNVRSQPMSRHCQAVRNANIEKVREYLTEVSLPFNCDFNCTEQNGWTLLHHAAHCGNLDIIQLLVANGYSIHALDATCGRLPAHIAAREGHTETVEFFLNNGISAREIDESGWTLLHYAAWKGSPGTVSFLIENGARVNAKDKCLGKTPLQVASEEGHTEVVAALLNCDADIDDCDDYGQTAIFCAATQGCVETVKLLLGKNANVKIVETILEFEPLHVAAYMDRVDVLEFFLDQGANIQNRAVKCSFTPLHCSAINGSLNSTRLLVDRGADLHAEDCEGCTPFDRAEDHMDVASYLSIEMIKKFQILGNHSDVLKIYRKLFGFQKEKLGLDNSETLDTHSNMAKVMYEQGQYNEVLDILKDVHARRGSSKKDALLTKCELRMAIHDAQIKFNEALEDLKDAFQKCETDLNADNDLHDPLNVACDIASVYFRNREYDKMFNILNRVLEPKEPSLSMVQTAALQKSSDISLKNKMEGLDSQNTKNILVKYKDSFGCIKFWMLVGLIISIACFFRIQFVLSK